VRERKVDLGELQAAIDLILAAAREAAERPAQEPPSS
jgi:hypothetical protein